MSQEKSKKELSAEKHQLRKSVRRRIKELSLHEQRCESEQMTRAFIQQPEWKHSSDVLLFLSMQNEIDTRGLVREAITGGKRLWAPRLHGDEMEFHLIWDGNTMEPANPSTSQRSTHISNQELQDVHDLPGLEYNPYGIWEPRSSAPVFTGNQLPAEFPTQFPTPAGGNKRGDQAAPADSTDQTKYVGPIAPDDTLGPAETKEFCIVVTPGLAFDREGHRLGRGKGYYDKWFSRFRRSLMSNIILPVGVGFSVQLLEAVPFDKNDIPLPRLLIGGEIVHCTLSR